MRNVDEPEKTWDDVKVPEEVGIHSDAPQKEGYKISPKGDPTIGTCRRKIGQIDPGSHHFGVCNPVPLDEETGDLQKKNEKEGDDVFFLCLQLIRPEKETADNG